MTDTYAYLFPFYFFGGSIMTSLIIGNFYLARIARALDRLRS